jgi:hypothetical protein
VLGHRYLAVGLVWSIVIVYAVRELGLTAAAVGAVLSVGQLGGFAGAALASKSAKIVGVGRIVVTAFFLFGPATLLLAGAPTSFAYRPSRARAGRSRTSRGRSTPSARRASAKRSCQAACRLESPASSRQPEWALPTWNGDRRRARRSCWTAWRDDSRRLHQFSTVHPRRGVTDAIAARPLRCVCRPHQTGRSER